MKSSLLTESYIRHPKDTHPNKEGEAFTPENIADKTVNELLWTYSPPEEDLGSRSGQLTQAQIGVIMSDIYTSINKDFHPTDIDIEGFIRAIKGYTSDTLSRAELKHAILKKVGHIGFEDHNAHAHHHLNDNSLGGMANSQFFRSMTYVRNTAALTKVDSKENIHHVNLERNYSSHPAQMDRNLQDSEIHDSMFMYQKMQNKYESTKGQVHYLRRVEKITSAH